MDVNPINRYFEKAGLPVEGSLSVTPQATALEAQGWRPWLMTLMGFAFEEDFSSDHIEYWDLYWSVLMRIRKQKGYFATGLVPKDEKDQEAFFRRYTCWIDLKEYAIMLLLGRGLAKSSTIEAAAVMKGCLIGSGYCLYICEAQDQAEEHLGNCKGLIDDPDSLVPEYYPHMRIDENAMFRGKKTKNRTDLFITVGGWVGRAKGLNAALRGIRIGSLRPDLINVDDIDGVNDSIAVSMKKLRQLTGSVFPTNARRHAQINVGQNLILETGVVNMIYSGMTDALAERTIIGVTNTFETFRLNHEYVTVLDQVDGRVKHKILPSAVPTWAGVRISDAQKFLNDSGLETFLAEYMNSFAHMKNEKVFVFDEERHLITWDMFEEVFGVRHIPGHWRAKAAGDLGYSTESLSAWGFYARSAQNAKFPGLYFGYRMRTFTLDSIEDQAIRLWEDLFPDSEIGKRHFEATQQFADYPELFRTLNTRPRCARYLKNFQYNPIRDKYDLKPVDPFLWRNIDNEPINDEDKALFYVKQANKTFRSQIQSWVISHEKTGEQKTLAKMYGIPATKVARFEADAGVAEANHLLRGDYTQPHPFYPDEIVPETGLYRLGRPFLYFIVRRLKAPEDDQDMKVFREQVSGQRWTQEKLGELGLSKSIPMKYKSDHCDQLRMFATDYALPESTKKTIAEEVEARIPEKYRADEGKAMSPEEYMSHQAAREFAEEQTKRELGLIDEDEEDY